MTKPVHELVYVRVAKTLHLKMGLKNQKEHGETDSQNPYFLRWFGLLDRQRIVKYSSVSIAANHRSENIP